MVTTIDAPLQWVETVATLKLSEQADRHLQSLMDRNNEGKVKEVAIPTYGSVPICLGIFDFLKSRIALLPPRSLRLIPLQIPNPIFPARIDIRCCEFKRFAGLAFVEEQVGERFAAGELPIFHHIKHRGIMGRLHAGT